MYRGNGMTKEEIKDSVSMKEVIQRYGLPEPNRAGFISCPFHKGDRQPSMRIYEQDYHCFACGENGDIFTFVQQMEDVPFKEAFLSLGGTYPEREEPSFSRRLRAYRRQKQKRLHCAGRHRSSGRSSSLSARVMICGGACGYILRCQILGVRHTMPGRKRFIGLSI